MIAAPAWAQIEVGVEVEGDIARVQVSTLTGLELDLEIAFEESLGLTEESLGLSAREISLVDTGILDRLPADVSIPQALPLLVEIEPPTDGPLTFTGLVSIEVHTHNLLYLPDTPLRLFAAPLDGGFRDITETMGTGSYRARGTKGGFSQFLIVADLRDPDLVIDQKFAWLQGVLDSHHDQLDAEVLTRLQNELSAAYAAWSVGDLREAIEELGELSRVAREHSGHDIPDLWRSSRDLVNVAGELRAGADTTRFSLNQRAISAL